MAGRTIFTIGFALPGDVFEYIPFESDQSLLDADIVLFEVGFGRRSPSETYQGEPLFNHRDSVRIAESLRHWKSELAAAMKAGKLVVVFLASPRTSFRYTGEQEYSGTGRSRVPTNIVERVASYSSVPSALSVERKSGREVRLTKDAGFLKPYWAEFGDLSDYEAFISGEFTSALVVTKSGGKTTGAIAVDNGALLLLPPIRFDEEAFTRYDANSQKALWNAAGHKFGNKLAKSLFALSDSILGGRQLTPPPNWVLDTTYSTPQEGELYAKVADVTRKVGALQNRLSKLNDELDEAGAVRALLYEQGKPLERAVREALTTLGFEADSFDDGESEFDVVFTSPEGRCLGEVEGRDSKAIGIDKFSQLERNLQEDFQHEDVSDYAKGVLFGNAERLKPLDQRGEAFTAKCLTAAKRVQAALVRTSDLFDPVRYLRAHDDDDYAVACRRAILESLGDIVEFPQVPVDVVAGLGEETAPASV